MTGDGEVVLVHAVDEAGRGPLDSAADVGVGPGVIQGSQQRLEQVVQRCHGRVRLHQRPTEFQQVRLDVVTRRRARGRSGLGAVPGEDSFHQCHGSPCDGLGTGEVVVPELSHRRGKVHGDGRR